MKIIKEVGLTFDDVLLVPKKSDLSSRFGNNINFTSEILPDIELRYPLISSNMDTVTEYRMANAMWSLNGLGIIHRFMSDEDHVTQLKNMVGGPKIGCVGVGTGGILRANMIKELCDAFLVDIAHGHSDSMIEMIKFLKQFGKPIIAGNVATAEGAIDVIKAGAMCVKVGVGPGSLCTTRIQTGNGVPQLTAIINVRNAIDKWHGGNNSFKPTIIADGGIKNSGDIIKALAAGANAVMIGRLFSGTTESPGNIINVPGRSVKVYRGMASRIAQESWKGKATSVEGENTWVPYTGDVLHIFEGLIAGMRSGMSYQNAHNLYELYENAVFIRQTHAGFREATPHGLR